MNDEKQFNYFFKGEIMQENKITLKNELADGQYRAWFRCSNCGTLFQHDMRKGTPSSEMAGSCPICGVRSGAPKIGRFELVKFNPEQDLIQQRHYFK